MKEAAIPYMRLELTNGRLRLVSARALDRGLECMVLVQPLAVGICRSDVREIQGTRLTRRDFGHEVVGRVKWERDSRLRKDDVVVLDPHVALAYRSTGYGTIMEVHGTRTAVESAVIRFQPGDWVQLGFFVEPLACAVHCQRLVVRVHDRVRRVQVIGAGTAGVLLSAAFAMNGVSVTLTNRSAERLEFLHRCGLGDIGDIALGPGVGEFDAVVVASTEFRQGLGMAGTLRSAGLLVPYGATLSGELWEGVDIHELRQKESRAGTSRGVAQGSYGARYRDFVAAQRLLELSPPLRSLLRRLVTHHCTLQSAPQLLSDMANGARVSKAVITGWATTAV